MQIILKHIISSYLFFLLAFVIYWVYISKKINPVYTNAEPLRQNHQGDHGFCLHDP